jgi:hypothetical protein
MPGYKVIPRRRWSIGSGSTRPFFVRLPAPLARQISPGKNARCPCTTAAFTLSAIPLGFAMLVLAHPQTRPSMRFLFVASHVCTPASSFNRVGLDHRQVLAALPSPSASGYDGFIMNSCRHSHWGLSPHYIAPMLGVHPAVNTGAPPKSRRSASHLEHWAS